MAILSANMTNLYDARIRKAFYQYLEMFPDERSAWCEELTSKDQYEKVSLYSELPMPGQVGEYENIPEVHFYQGPVRTWTHVKYAAKIIASRESIDDEKFPVIIQSAQSLGQVTKYRIETQGAYDLNNAFTVSTVGKSNTADETLCATSHATFTGAAGAAQANRPTADITLGADSLWAAIENFAGLDDHQGNPIMCIPSTLIIHPANERTAIEILKSIEVPYKSTNEINAIRLTQQARGLSYKLGHFLSSTTAWFVTTDKKPIRFYMRQYPDVERDETITNQSLTWVVSCRLSHGPYDWYQIYGTDGVP